MSKLINPGAGDILDRLTILHLKIAHATQVKRDPTHWGTEAAALMPKIQARALSGIVIEQLLRLATVNGMLWQHEDDLRAWRGGSDPVDRLYTGHELEQIRILAFQIQDLNDQRARLITMINCNMGDATAEEKL